MSIDDKHIELDRSSYDVLLALPTDHPFMKDVDAMPARATDPHRH